MAAKKELRRKPRRRGYPEEEGRQEEGHQEEGHQEEGQEEGYQEEGEEKGHQEKATKKKRYQEAREEITTEPEGIGQKSRGLRAKVAKPKAATTKGPAGKPRRPARCAPTFPIPPNFGRTTTNRNSGLAVERRTKPAELTRPPPREHVRVAGQSAPSATIGDERTLLCTCTARLLISGPALPFSLPRLGRSLLELLESPPGREPLGVSAPPVPEVLDPRVLSRRRRRKLAERTASATQAWRWDRSRLRRCEPDRPRSVAPSHQLPGARVEHPCSPTWACSHGTRQQRNSWPGRQRI